LFHKDPLFINNESFLYNTKVLRFLGRFRDGLHSLLLFLLFFKPFSVFSNLRELFIKSCKSSKNKYSKSYLLKGFVKENETSNILGEHLKRGEPLFSGRGKGGLSFFNICEYKTPFKESLKYFGLEVRKYLVSPAKQLKFFFFNSYFYRKIECLRVAHSKI
jgi:hypothetical protein